MHRLSVSDHATLYLQLAQVELKLGHTAAARELLHEAQNRFSGTLQEGRVTIAQAMFAARQDLDQALVLLRQVSVKSPFFVNARSQMAKLYLVELHHPAKYIACYEEVVEEQPSVQALVALGEAYGVIG
uniref:Tetratricopeptide repeat protein 21B n=1 Tax=Lygus hesperus TaxID=30085 RepID=A0A0A9XYU5_LYGHE